MKSLQLLLFLLLLFSVLLGNSQDKEFYQLKTYSIKSEKQEKMVDDYLSQAFLPALKRYGINNVGVFKVRPSKFILMDKIHVLIPFASLNQFEALEQKLIDDKVHQDAGKDYLMAAYDTPPYERINSVLLRAFPEMPQMRPTEVTGKRMDRVYELRSYESPTEVKYKNKVEMFNAGGEVQLFSDLGFNAVFYAEVISGDTMPNLMYMTTFPNMEKRDALWKAFGSSDKWTELKNDEYYKNNMSKLDSYLLYPTEYSDY